MTSAAEPAGRSASALRAALLDYYRAPGKYQLTRRQPALLFSSIRDILQIAAGRGAAEGPDGAQLCEAASFFVRAALLYPGADHYAVMGLAGGEAPADLKERYRLLMRLIHPDFAREGAAAWPAEAAMRVNRAYEVLSSPVLRRDYDEHLAALAAQRPSSNRKPGVARNANPKEGRRARLGRKAAWGLALAAAIPLVLLLFPRAEPEHLVLRPRVAVRPQPNIAPAPAANDDLALPSPAQPTTTTPETPLEEPVALARTPEPAPVPTPPVVQPAAPSPTPPAAVVPHLPAPQPPAVVRPAPIPHTPPALAQETAPAAPPEPLRTASSSIAPPTQAILPPPPPAPVIAIAAPKPGSAAAGTLATTLSMRPIAAPTLADAQPLLTQVLQMLETGNGEQLLRLLDGEARASPAAQALTRRYDQMVKGSRPIRLSQVQFQGEPRDGGILLVTGVVHLHAGEPTIGSRGQELVLRAEFARRDGKVLLTGLSGAPE